jgi:hypothetical protein
MKRISFNSRFRKRVKSHKGPLFVGFRLPDRLVWLYEDPFSSI